MSNRTIKKDKNKVGTVFALVENENGNGLVYVLKSNHNSNVRGGIATRWACCNLTQKQSHKDFQAMAIEGLPMVEAEALFNKKINGRAK